MHDPNGGSPAHDGQEGSWSGRYEQAVDYGQSLGRQVCGAASRHPWLAAAALGGAAALAAAAFAGWRAASHGRNRPAEMPEAGEMPGAPNYAVTEDLHGEAGTAARG